MIPGCTRAVVNGSTEERRSPHPKRHEVEEGDIGEFEERPLTRIRIQTKQHCRSQSLRTARSMR